MKTRILSHDIGTSGDKATLFGEDGKLIASAFSPYPTHYPRPGWAEQDAADYWRAFCTTTSKVIGMAAIKPSDIAVVAFSGQMMAALPVDANGRPLRRSIIWADMRSTAEEAELRTRIPPERIYAITGHRLSAAYTAPKIMWLMRNEPEVVKHASAFIQAKDYLVARLIGTVNADRASASRAAIGSDVSDGSGTLLMDIRTMDWSEELLAAADIPRSLLPALHESTEIAGSVTRASATESGLAEGTPVVFGAGDGACATAGAGVVRPGEGYLCLGTSTWLAAAAAEPLFDPAMRTVTFAHFRHGLYMPCGTMQSGGGSLQWFRDALTATHRTSSQNEATSASSARGGVLRPTYEEVNALAASVPVGSESLLFLPYLMGERSPHWNPLARGCFIGLSPIHTSAHMARAIMEGVAMNMRIILDAFELQNVTFPSIRVIGGGARSQTWLPVFADVFERPVAATNFSEEATSVGAAVAGGVGVGLFGSIEEAASFVTTGEALAPEQEHFATYRRLYDVFRDAYERLIPVFVALR